MRQTTKTGLGRIGASRLATVALVGGGLALLLWGKLRLVTQVPRTAYAEPEVSPPVDEGGQTDETDASGDSGGASEPGEDSLGSSAERGGGG